MPCRACQLVLLAALAICRAGADLSVVAIGDWGGRSDEEPTTPSQRATAVGLRRKAEELNASFVMLMGDNFYQHGIRDSDLSSRFRDTFEAVYAALLPGRRFYAFAGNHDYGEGLLANVSAQLAYTRRSAQWYFPSLWYKVHREFEADGHARTLDVLVLDTVVLCGISGQDDTFINQELEFLGGGAPSSGVGRREAVAEEQWAWLERELSASTADYLWVSGHYPIWSVGTDGSSQCLVHRLRPLLMAHGAHYISGHDHMLEHFYQDGLNTFVVGAGKECCYPPANLATVPPGAARYMLAGELGASSRPPAPFPVLGGFASLQFGAESVAVTLHAHNGTALYTAPPINRRRASHEVLTFARQLAVQMVPSCLQLACAAVAAVVTVVAATALGLTALRGPRGEWWRSARAPLLQVE